MKLGTEWVAPGTGATVNELRMAFGLPPQTMDGAERTNLVLTGSPLQAYDRERLRAATTKGYDGLRSERAFASDA